MSCKRRPKHEVIAELMARRETMEWVADKLRRLESALLELRHALIDSPRILKSHLRIPPRNT